MDTHMRGPAFKGQGVIPNQRALTLLFSAAAATTNLLTVEATAAELPVRVEVEVVVKTAFNGTGASIVVNGIDEANVSTTIATGTLTANASVRGTYLAYGKDRIEVVFAPGTTATTGKGAVFARIAGVGVLT